MVLFVEEVEVDEEVEFPISRVTNLEQSNDYMIIIWYCRISSLLSLLLYMTIIITDLVHLVILTAHFECFEMSE